MKINRDTLKCISTWIPKKLHKEIKKKAIDLEITEGQLMQNILENYFKK